MYNPYFPNQSAQVHYLDERLQELHAVLLGAGLGHADPHADTPGTGQATLVSWAASRGR